MADPRQTVSSIRAFLASGKATAEAQPKSIAAEYARMCTEANFRLRRCADFLREGLRGEALAHARAKPPLLELVSALHFPEAGDWERTCTAMNLPRPGRLAIDAAHYLADAARQQEPLEELLARYRYLSLARAEPAKRLEVLRQLIAADPDSQCWKRDAEELQTVRLASLRSEASAAARIGDIAQVHKLLNELNAGQWIIPIPADLQEILARESSSLAEAAAVARLRELVPHVRAALAEGSYEQGRQVFQEWGAVVRETRISVPPEYRQEILPLAQWLDEEDDRREQEKKFRAACATLMSAVQARAPVEQLTKLYRQTVGFQSAMPENISAAYHRALESARREQRAEKRKQYALAALLVGLILAAIAALVIVIMYTGGH
jgi:hypothetical protein